MPQILTSAHRVIAEFYDLFPLGLGAMPLSLAGRPSEDEALAVILCFFEIGGNFIDTADVYGLDDEDRGHNEKLIAKAIKEYGSPSNLLIATKGGASRPNGGWGMGGGKPSMLRKACESSLKNLEIESHSLYYLHGPDAEVPLADSFGELARLKEEGKIQYLGIANIDLEQLQLVRQISPVVAVQNRLNPFCKEDLSNGLIEFCKSEKIAYVPYCPLGGWADHQRLSEYTDFHAIANKYQVTTYELALAWLLHKGDHIVPIPGMDKEEQVMTNRHALNLSLSLEDMKVMDQFPDLYLPKHVDPV